MVDKTGLQIIGWVFGGATIAVVLVASALVGTAIASGQPVGEDGPSVTVSLPR